MFLGTRHYRAVTHGTFFNEADKRKIYRIETAGTSNAHNTFLKVQIHWIRIHILAFWWIGIQTQVTAENIFIFIFIKTAIHVSLPFASITDVQATGGAFSLRKRTSSTSKLEMLNFFLFLWVIFYPPGSGSSRLKPMRVWLCLCVWKNSPDVLPVCVLAGVGQSLVVRHELAESARSCNIYFWK